MDRALRGRTFRERHYDSLNKDIKIASVALRKLNGKKTGGQLHSKTWLLRHRCSALPTELWRPTHIVSGSMDHFRVAPGPLFLNEGRCSAFDMEMIFHSHANKTHFHKKVVHLASFWKRGFLELGSGLFSSCLNSWKEWKIFFQVNLKLVKLLLQLQQSHHHLNLYFRNLHHNVQ